jgi:hypothetical protein
VSTTGQCRCGKVKFAFDGPVLLTAACHCRGCQRMTGGAFSLSTGTLLSRFRLTEGETVIGGLHGETKHYFCDFCKSWLYTTLEAVGDFVNVRTTMLDDGPQASPFVETYTAEALPWAKTGAVHSYEALPSMDDYGTLMQEFAAAQGG